MAIGRSAGGAGPKVKTCHMVPNGPKHTPIQLGRLGDEYFLSYGGLDVSVCVCAEKGIYTHLQTGHFMPLVAIWYMSETA